MTPQRAEYLSFTEPFAEIPAVIVVRDDVEEDLTLEKLRGMRLVVTTGYAEHDFILDRYSDAAALIGLASSSVSTGVVFRNPVGLAVPFPETTAVASAAANCSAPTTPLGT